MCLEHVRGVCRKDKGDLPREPLEGNRNTAWVASLAYVLKHSGGDCSGSSGAYPEGRTPDGGSESLIWCP